MNAKTNGETVSRVRHCFLYETSKVVSEALEGYKFRNVHRCFRDADCVGGTERDFQAARTNDLPYVGDGSCE